MDQALLDEGYRCYTGEKIDVYWKVRISRSFLPKLTR